MLLQTDDCILWVSQHESANSPTLQHLKVFLGYKQAEDPKYLILTRQKLPPHVL